jgi:hypothetical protein
MPKPLWVISSWLVYPRKTGDPWNREVPWGSHTQESLTNINNWKKGSAQVHENVAWIDIYFLSWGHGKKFHTLIPTRPSRRYPWAVTLSATAYVPCRLVEIYGSVGGSCRLILQGRRVIALR